MQDQGPQVAQCNMDAKTRHHLLHIQAIEAQIIKAQATTVSTALLTKACQLLLILLVTRCPQTTFVHLSTCFSANPQGNLLRNSEFNVLRNQTYSMLPG